MPTLTGGAGVVGWGGAVGTSVVAGWTIAGRWTLLRPVAPLTSGGLNSPAPFKMAPERRSALHLANNPKGPGEGPVGWDRGVVVGSSTDGVGPPPPAFGWAAPVGTVTAGSSTTGVEPPPPPLGWVAPVGAVTGGSSTGGADPPALGFGFEPYWSYMLPSNTSPISMAWLRKVAGSEVTWFT